MELPLNVQPTTLRHVPPLPHLREIRERRLLTQIELADKAGVGRTTIIRIEQGESNVRPRTIKRLARALRVRPEALLG
jgi:transcriptional regulator with XRE-family HTH domain